MKKFFHVGAKIKTGKIYASYDLTEEELVINAYVVPFIRNEEFIVSGTKINSDEIETLYILNTNSSIDDIRNDVEKELNDKKVHHRVEIFKYCYEYNVFDDLLAKVKKINEVKLETNEKAVTNNKNIFIVHGHDESMLKTVKEFVMQIGYKPIVLKDEPNQGKTIIEKIESYSSNVVYAIVLYSPCDKGFPNNKPEEVKYRARQNVVFEHGFLISQLKRERVCALVKKDVEKPSDIGGIIYIPYSGNWRSGIIKELTMLGLPIRKFGE